ncbi:proteobacterial dedicated sortase system histidine kinase [Alteromonas sp. ASW11-130]|uniref:proteobacterial dedicated sortase system histidine kinase n=1 Tax=Alteromonas sp. ASW11-130 TaxID=3015775 RepID=UPI002241D605|nr:proteobacterial dedicated sortase system histidine kinase [Alteromonas sp. ASW11-130]MCW8091968.1 proteobacterial dedicated sortase system histidine kinase [Alteromonas sp. ASW11-130]
MRFRFSIRFQLVILSLFLFTIPWLGYQYVWEVEEYLRNGQEQTMLGTARAVATALHERKALFESRSSYLQNIRPGTDLYAPQLDNPIRLDGKFDDWQDIIRLAQVYGNNKVVQRYIADNSTTSLSFTHMVGKYEQYLYAMFKVEDEQLIWRNNKSLKIDKSDHLLISLLDKHGKFSRYSISPYQPGWINAYRLDDDSAHIFPIENALEIQGHWRQTQTGYNIELRFPLSLFSGSLAFALVDVDDPLTREKKYAIGTADPNQFDKLGTVVSPSPEIEQILAGLKYADSRVWVVDRHQRVLAKAGNIQAATGVRVKPRKQFDWAWLNWIEKHWILPVYYHILTRPPDNFVDELENAYEIETQGVKTALAGRAESLWRLTPDNRAVILSASHPIFIDGEVRGAVIVEQTTHGIRTLRNRALEQLFHVIIAVMLLGTLGLFLFANRISSRIRRLRDQTESVIDESGKIVGQLSTARQQDEIGDLSRTFATVIERLQQYNSYLENMASRLSHELRTPIAIVKSSLDNLKQFNTESNNEGFIERAQDGITRLSTILNRMSEATRLEHAITQEESERVDLTNLLSACFAGYQQAYDTRKFVFSKEIDLGLIKGVPELLVQMLDKVVSNAVEFSQPDDTITLQVCQSGKYLQVKAVNPGPLLPNDMQDELLQSMVSVRTDVSHQDTTTAPHLGLGLYIANTIAMFHKGHLQINNLADHSGVVVTISLPKL